MKKWVLILLLVLLWLPFQPARGQEIELASVGVDIWPEYDQPAALVIYRISLPEETVLPVELALRIPAAAGEPHAVAARQVDGLNNIPYQRQVSGAWATISLSVPQPQTQYIQIEYYDPALVKEGALRTFAYQWPGDYAVQAMSIQVQQPLQATDMRIAPSLGSGVLGQDGLTYYQAEIGAVKAGQTVQISLSYQNSSDQLSLDGLQVRPSAPIPASSLESAGWTRLLPWALAILGVTVIAGGIWWYWRSGQQHSTSKRRRKRPHPALVKPEEGGIPAAVAAPAAEDNIYCHQCGTRAQLGDVFCRSCGMHLRSD